MNISEAIEHAGAMAINMPPTCKDAEALFKVLESLRYLMDSGRALPPSGEIVVQPTVRYAGIPEAITPSEKAALAAALERLECVRTLLDYENLHPKLVAAIVNRPLIPEIK